MRGPKFDIERAEQMAALFRQGITYAAIGKKYGVSRQAVEQRLRRLGVSGGDGGARMKGQLRALRKEYERETRVRAKWGVDVAVWRECRANGVIGAYERQRQNSRARGIEWRLTFAEWYAVWIVSGKLQMRGRGKNRYCMSRISDAGAYEIGNVHVQTNAVNGREAVAQWKGKKKPVRGIYLLLPGRELAWQSRVGKVNLGYFASADEAAAARANFIAANPGVRHAPAHL